MREWIRQQTLAMETVIVRVLLHAAYALIFTSFFLIWLVNETAVIRWDYGDPALGTCTESAEGGNHFRYWIQNGPLANTGAIFMALSYEEPSSGKESNEYEQLVLIADALSRAA